MLPKEIYEEWGTPEQKIIESNPESLIVSHIEFGEGIKVFLKGHQYPQKGIPTQEAISAINVPKRFLRCVLTEWWYILPLLGIKRFIRGFTGVSWPVMSPHILKYQFMSPTSQAVYDLLKEVDVQMAKIVAHVIEYDAAYRFRLMDLASETSKEKLLKNPRKELKRLLQLHKERDYEEVVDKVGGVGRLCTYALFYPPFKKAFVRAIESVDFKKLQYDEADRYWAMKKRDYSYFGLSYADRQRDN